MVPGQGTAETAHSLSGTVTVRLAITKGDLGRAAAGVLAVVAEKADAGAHEAGVPAVTSAPQYSCSWRSNRATATT